MPLPETANVGTIMHELKHKGKKKRSRKQMIAIALDQARKSGAKIPKKKINNSERRLGNPRTNAERQKRHLVRFGITKLPPRGTGLR